MDTKPVDEAPFLTTLNHASSDPFRLLVESVKDYGIFMLNPAGNVSSWNPGAEKSKGYKADEIVGKHVSCFYTPVDVAHGKPQRELDIALKDGRFETEGVRQRKDGTTFWAIVTITNIHDSFGQHIGFANVTRDITERKDALDALRLSEESSRSLIESIPALAWVYDAIGKPLLHNHRWYEYTGQTPEEVAANHWHEALHLDDTAQAMGVWDRCVASGEPYSTEYRIRRHDGVYRWFLSQGTAVKGETGIEKWVGICTDIDDRKRTEDELRESEERYRTLAAATTAIVWDTPASGEFEKEQLGWTAFTGQSFEQLRGWGWLNALHPDDREETARVWTEAFTSRIPYHVHHRIRRADGEYRRMAVRAVPILGPSGKIHEWVGVHTDVTDNLRATDALALSESRYRRLFEAAQDGILIVDVDSRRVFDVNPFLLKLVGFTREELVGKELWEIGFFKDIVSNKNAFQTLTDKGYIRYEHLPLKTKDGRQIPVEFVSNVYEVGGSQVVQCNIRDISARVHAEDELRLRDRAIQAATQGLLITDPSQTDNPLVYVSPGFERITGYRSHEALGRNCRFLQGPGSDPAIVAKLRQAIVSVEPCSVELVNYRKDGTSFWNELSISPVRDDAGRLTHFVGVQADVSARRKLESQFHQAQKMEAVGQLAGGVAHDFNNLLTIISGYSEILLGSLPSYDPNRSLVKAIAEAGERAAGLTRQLLFFSRQAVLQTKVLDLNEVVEETESLLRRMIGEDVLLATVLAPNLRRIKADPGQLGQVLMNLAINARDAMPRGGKLTFETSEVRFDEAFVATHAECKPGRYVKLAVSDNGNGMTPEVQAHVFEPFFTTKGPGKGTGLGLATVYGIVKQNAGFINLYSEPGKGTTFKIFFPAVDERSQPSSHDMFSVTPPVGTETILVVEDEDGVRAFAVLALQMQGYQVLHADNGEKALRIVAKHEGRIDLLMTDVVMPGMSGRELAESLSVQLPEMKVMYVSGYTDDAVIRHGILQTDVAFLQKPYTPRSLASKVREVLDQQRLPAEAAGDA
jgi:two-component system cell cycle sensor histidine kinase/response regulator CckA